MLECKSKFKIYEKILGLILNLKVDILPQLIENLRKNKVTY